MHCLENIPSLEIFSKFPKHSRIFHPNSASRVSIINYTKSRIYKKIQIYSLVQESSLLYKRDRICKLAKIVGYLPCGTCVTTCFL